MDIANPSPVGSFFPLGLLDIPPSPDSVWDAWCGRGRPCITAWTARAAFARLIAIKSPRRVWLPAYSCPELAAAVPAALLRFFPMDEDLSPKCDVLRRSLRAGDLLLATDYFGWPPGSKFLKFMAERPDVLWVEDRAQCLFTDTPPWAPWVLYSPRKLVGVPDGGIVVSAADTAVDTAGGQYADASLALPELMRFEDTAETNNKDWYRAFKSREARFTTEPRPMSRMTEALLRRIPLRPLVEARRRNYEFLFERLSLRAAWRRPAAGVTPFGLVIRTRDGAALGAALADQRLFCQRYWPTLAVGASEFPWENELARSHVTLPCDQRYDESSLMRLVEAVYRFAPAAER